MLGNHRYDPLHLCSSSGQTTTTTPDLLGVVVVVLVVGRVQDRKAATELNNIQSLVRHI